MTRKKNDFFEAYKHPLWQHDQKIYTEFMQKDFLTVKNKVRTLMGMSEIKYN